MMKMTALLKKDQGSVIVAAMLILVLLTIIGIAATSTSRTELNITANTQLHKMAFFTAESGWQHLTNWLDDEYPLPTQNIGSKLKDPEGTDIVDNDLDGLFNEPDEAIDDYASAQYAAPEALPLSDTHPSWKYFVTAEFQGAGIAPGWDPSLFLKYNYQITSIGEVPAREGMAVWQVTAITGKITEK
jgi:hypothetical protein